MTNALTNLTSSALTMSSKEIAELTGKEHKNVIRDIREMMEVLEEDGSDLSHVSEEKDARGYTACFNLPKDLTITLISGYNVKMRHAITKRWMELEEAQAPAVPRTYAEALMAAAQAEMAKEALALENAKKDVVITQQAETIAIAAPKADYYDVMVERGNGLIPTEVAAALNLPEYSSAAKVNALLMEMGWQFKKQRVNKPGFKWMPKSFAIEKGYITVRSYVSTDTEHTGQQLLVTPKGMRRLRHYVGLGFTEAQSTEFSSSVAITCE